MVPNFPGLPVPGGAEVVAHVGGGGKIDREEPGQVRADVVIGRLVPLHLVVDVLPPLIVELVVEVFQKVLDDGLQVVGAAGQRRAVHANRHQDQQQGAHFGTQHSGVRQNLRRTSRDARRAGVQFKLRCLIIRIVLG